MVRGCVASSPVTAQADACNLIYVGTVDQNRKVVVKA